MHPKEFTSRLKHGTFSGFTMKEKHVRELVQLIENEAKEKQQLLAEIEKSNTALEKFELDNQQLKDQIAEVLAELDETRDALKNECKSKEEFEEKYTELSNKYDAFEIRATKQYAIGLEDQHKSDKKLLELTAELEKYKQKGADQPATSSVRSVSEVTEPSSSEEALTDKAANLKEAKGDHFEKAFSEISHNHDFVAKAFDAAKQGFKQGVLEAIGDLERSLKEL